MSNSLPAAPTSTPGTVAELPSATPAAPNSPEAMRQVLGDPQDAVFCTFDPKTPAGLRLMDKCAEAPDARLKDLVNLPLRLEHVYAHYVDLVNKETQEVSTCVRCCLIDTDGKVYSCVSEGIRKSILRLSMQHGLPPWKKGVPVTVSLKTLGNGHQWLTLLNAPEVAGKAGKS